MSAEWLIPEHSLTPEQQRAVTFSPYKPRVVFGPPGSGKTIILVYRATYLQKNYQIKENRYLILAFTNALKEYIQSGLRDLDMDPARVLTFDKWCKTFHEQQIGTPPRSKGSADPEATRQAVHAHLTHTSNQKKLFDAVLVDEGQDLDRISFEILTRISEHVTVLIDHKQQIYSSGSNEREILNTFGLRRINMALLEGFRFSPAIAEIAASFVTDPEQAEYFRRQIRTCPRGKETPLLFVARDFAEEMEQVMTLLKTRQTLGERIGLLLPERWQVEKFPELCAKHGLVMEGPPLRLRGRKTDYPLYDFGSDRPKVMTYHSAKGLTFDTVFMPRLTPRHFRGGLAEKMNELLFVGVTRAVGWLFLSTVHNDMIAPIRSLYNKALLAPKEINLTLKHGRYERQASLFEYNRSKKQAERKVPTQNIFWEEETQSNAYADLF